MFAVDVDDSSEEVKVMSNKDLGAFKKTEAHRTKQKNKGYKKSKGKSVSKKKDKMIKTQQVKSRRILQRKESSSSESSQVQEIQSIDGPVVKKLRSQSSSEESSEERLQIKPARKKKQKIKPFVRLTPDQRFNRQIPASDLVKFGHSYLVKVGGRSPAPKYLKKAREVLKGGITWWIINGEYEQNGWSTIFNDLYLADFRDLRMHNNDCPNLLKEIYHVHYDSLEILLLKENRLKSIDLMARMRIPNVKELDVSRNFITSLRPMARMNLEKLQILVVANNPIVDMQNFYFINFLSLQQLFLEWKSDSAVTGDLCWLAMLKKDPTRVDGLTKIMVQSKERIVQKEVDKMLGYKYRCNHLMVRK